jgi:hypothetical protein
VTSKAGCTIKKKTAYNGTCKAKVVYNLKKNILSKLQRVNRRPLEGLTCFGLEGFGCHACTKIIDDISKTIQSYAF